MYRYSRVLPCTHGPTYQDTKFSRKEFLLNLQVDLVNLVPRDCVQGYKSTSAAVYSMCADAAAPRAAVPPRSMLDARWASAILIWNLNQTVSVITKVLSTKYRRPT
eukprot:SAG31_NODE_556_length_14161_cov_3.384943_10_plen_106_part_00